jgi:hypothetical protein
MNILEMVKEARKQLRSTQINWQEPCLFACDDILTGVINELEQPAPCESADVQRGYFVVEDVSHD